MTYVLTTIVAFAFALGLLIVIHEFGHYLGYDEDGLDRLGMG